MNALGCWLYVFLSPSVLICFFCDNAPSLSGFLAPQVGEVTVVAAGFFQCLLTLCPD